MSNYRDYLFPSDHPRLEGLADLDPYSYADAMIDHPVAGPALHAWLALFESTLFTGITADGRVIPGLFPLGGAEGAPTAAATQAAQAFLSALTPEQAELVTHEVDSKVWRGWMNPEFYVNRFGLRLEELDEQVRACALALVEASLSPAGYTQLANAMATNAMLGDLVGLPALLNENSYNINVFGTPSEVEPWGWNLYGHHVCVNSLFIGGQQVLTPVFFGAEPNELETPHGTTPMFTEHESSALDLIRSLSPDQRAKAIIYGLKRDPAMPEGRIHPGDELHLGGAFQDNRVIPYEGLNLADATTEQKQKALAVIDVFLRYQPAGPRAARLTAVQEHWADTWLSWIGGTGDKDVFYCRIQSPVIMVEFDHHAGIWLANTEPEKFHIHTLVRTPNGNDYGAALVAETLGRPQRLAGPA